MKGFYQYILSVNLLFAVFFSASAQQQITLDVSPNVTTSIKGHSELNREKYINLAASPSEMNSKLSSTLFNKYVNDLEMTVGRKLYVVYSETNWGNSYRLDASRPGFMDTTYFKNQKNPNDSGLEKYLEKWGSNAGMAAHDGQNAYPSFIPKYTLSGSTESYPVNNDAAAEMAAYTLKYAYTGFQRPKYFELVNEPDWRFWSDQRFIDLHLKTKRKFKSMNIPTEVGGPCFSIGYFYKNNFDIKSIRTFIDATNFELDFYSFHIYDFMKWNDADNDFVGRVSSGLPEEAVFDAIAAHTFNKYGKEFTFVGSEHGGYVSDGTSLQYAENKLSGKYFPGSGFLHDLEVRSISNFILVNSAIANTLTFMNHPHIVKKAVPFILLESASWDPKYYSSLMVKENFDKNSLVWHESKLLHFYNFFKDVRGRRIQAFCNDADIQQISLVDENKLILVFHNQSNVVGNIKVNLENTENIIQEIKLRRFGRQVDFRPYFSEETISKLDNIQIKDQESIVVFVAYHNVISQQKELEITPFYSTEVSAQFSGSKDFTVKITQPEKVVSAELRVGIGRAANAGKQVDISLNGTVLNIPVEDCASRLSNETEYGSLRTIKIDPTLLKETNTVKVTFPDGKIGGVGAVVIRAAKLKSGISTGVQIIKNNDINIYPNPATNFINVDFSNRNEGQMEIRMYNLWGELVFAEILNTPTIQGEFKINRGNLNSGIYFLKISGSNWSEIKKVVLI